MNWTEEKYVKLYVRDTPTWRAWPWQAKALWPLLLRKLDGAGLLEIGRLQPAHAVSLMTELPIEVVEVALKALEDDETLVRVETGYLAPKFLEAQEARKSDALRASESRARRRNDAKSGGTASHGVTRRHETSQPVTLQPSPAQPSPTTTSSTPVDGSVERVFAKYQAAAKSPASKLNESRRKLIRARLKDFTEEELGVALDGYAKSPWHHGENDQRTKYLSLELWFRDIAHVEAGIAKAAGPPRAPDAPAPVKTALDPYPENYS